mmetsp:Transcript_64958/g.127748  ORF Transcript_64958/g.127748 Transcript_64958/m.127748 type:complete len:206 (+) Transcript_64958:179-796(+)
MSTDMRSVVRHRSVHVCPHLQSNGRLAPVASQQTPPPSIHTPSGPIQFQNFPGLLEPSTESLLEWPTGNAVSSAASRGLRLRAFDPLQRPAAGSGVHLPDAQRAPLLHPVPAILQLPSCCFAGGSGMLLSAAACAGVANRRRRPGNDGGNGGFGTYLRTSHAAGERDGVLEGRKPQRNQRPCLRPVNQHGGQCARARLTRPVRVQ